jgi:hypothetical protein
MVDIFPVNDKVSKTINVISAKKEGSSVNPSQGSATNNKTIPNPKNKSLTSVHDPV